MGRQGDPEAGLHEYPRGRLRRRGAAVLFGKVGVDLAIPCSMVPLANQGRELSELLGRKRIHSRFYFRKTHAWILARNRLRDNVGSSSVQARPARSGRVRTAMAIGDGDASGDTDKISPVKPDRFKRSSLSTLISPLVALTPRPRCGLPMHGPSNYQVSQCSIQRVLRVYAVETMVTIAAT